MERKFLAEGNQTLREVEDFNALRAKTGDSHRDGEIKIDWQSDITFTSVTCTVHFENIKKVLIGYINKYPCVIGCMAWLTDFDVLDALAGKVRLIH